MGSSGQGWHKDCNEICGFDMPIPFAVTLSKGPICELPLGELAFGPSSHLIRPERRTGERTQFNDQHATRFPQKQKKLGLG